LCPSGGAGSHVGGPGLGPPVARRRPKSAHGSGSRLAKALIPRRAGSPPTKPMLSERGTTSARDRVSSVLDRQRDPKTRSAIDRPHRHTDPESSISKASHNEDPALVEDFFASHGVDLHNVLGSSTGNRIVSLKNYLFFEREFGNDGKLLGWHMLLLRLAKLMGLVFSESTTERLQDFDTARFHPHEPFSLHDLLHMEGRVKFLNIVCAAVGDFFQFKGELQSQKEFKADHYRRAIDKYEEALADVPNDKSVLYNCAVTYYKLLLEVHQGKKRKLVKFDTNDHMVKTTRDYFVAAIEVSPKNYVLRCIFAGFMEDCGCFRETEEFLLNALEIEPNFSYALVQYARFLIDRRAMAPATAVLKRAKSVPSSCIDPLTGKAVTTIYRVYFTDDTFTSVEDSPLVSAAGLLEGVARTLRQKAEKRGPLEKHLVGLLLRISGLYFVQEEHDGKRYRPLKLDENPWLLPLSKTARIVCMPFRWSADKDTTALEHFCEQLDKVVDEPFHYPGKLVFPKVDAELLKLRQTLGLVLKDAALGHHTPRSRQPFRKSSNEAHFLIAAVTELHVLAQKLFCLVSYSCQHTIAFDTPDCLVEDYAASHQAIFNNVCSTRFLSVLQDERSKAKHILVELKSLASPSLNLLEHVLLEHASILARLDLYGSALLLTQVFAGALHDHQIVDKKLSSRMVALT